MSELEHDDRDALIADLERMRAQLTAVIRKLRLQLRVVELMEQDAADRWGVALHSVKVD